MQKIVLQTTPVEAKETQTLIRAKAVADRLDLPLQRVYTIARNGGFPPGILVRFSNTLRWNEDLLTDWINNGAPLGSAAKTEAVNDDEPNNLNLGGKTNEFGRDR